MFFSVKEMFYSKKQRKRERVACFKRSIRMLVRDVKIVECRADKDGKVFVVNQEDYNQIMKNKF